MEASRMDDYDFKQCMKYAPFETKEVKEIIACVPGEADGPNWHYIVQLTDESFGYVTGWCDYTGWGCRENGDGHKATTIEELTKKIPEKNKYYDGAVLDTLLKQVRGELPYGLRV